MKMEPEEQNLQIEVTISFYSPDENDIIEDEIKDFLKTSFEREMDYIEIINIEKKEDSLDTYILYFRKKNEIQLEDVLHNYIENEKQEVKENFMRNGFSDCKTIYEILGKSQKKKHISFDIEEDCHCHICLSEIKESEWIRKLPNCNHYFHKKCIDKWLKKNVCCPMCRRNQIDNYIEKCFEDEKERIKERMRNKNIES